MNYAKKTKTQKKDKNYKWVGMNVKEINEFPQQAVDQIKRKIKIIKLIKKEDRTFLNTVVAYESCNEFETQKVNQIYTLELCSSNSKVRDAARDAVVKFGNLMVDVAYDPKLYEAIKSYKDLNFEKEKSNLNLEDIKLLDDMMLGFRRMGFDLPSANRNKIKQIEKKINTLASKYDKNIAENNDFILCNEAEMEGIPEVVLNSFTKIKDLKSKVVKYKVTLNYPEYGPYMKYAKSREKREELYKLFNNVGGQTNVKILKELIRLRSERASILGYETHADYKLEDRMAKNPNSVYKMINDVTNSIKRVAQSDIETLKEEAKKDEVVDFKYSDADYYANKIKETKYSFDEQEVRQYFELNNVLKKMFEMYGNLFGFSVKENKTKLWHKDARLFDLVDSESNEVISSFAIDLFPREGKFSHACMMPINNQFAVIICNFSKPSKKTPSLLTLGEVSTLFHEFGHNLHNILTTSKYSSQAGTNVTWDFVEGPSQIMELWLEDEKVLKYISEHFESGKSLSAKILNQITSLKKFMQGYHYSRQGMLSLIDMELYTNKSDDPIRLYYELTEKYLMKQGIEGILFVSRFAHIARGYDAGYYSYMWAEIIAKDMYSVFEKEGLNNKKIGLKYRKEILEKGSSRDEMLSVEAFLGRKVNPKALVESLQN